MTVPLTPARIRCGNCSDRHFTAAGARACHFTPAESTWRCDWEAYLGPDREDGSPVFYTCNALAWETPTGWACDAGHAHATAEARAAQGWDYADGDGEAHALARAGVDPRAMSHGGAFAWGVAS